MNAQNAAAELLHKIVGGVIPKSTEEQRMPVQTQYKQIALVSLYAFHDPPHFVPFNQFGRQDYTLPLSRLSCTGQKVSVVIGRLLT